MAEEEEKVKQASSFFLAHPVSSNLKIWKIHPRSRVLYQVDDISLLDDNDELKITFAVPPLFLEDRKFLI
jgi:hypothetical protein